MFRIILDTNVLISALRSNRGRSFQIVREIGTGRFETVLSGSVFLEYQEVSHRLREATHRSVAEIENILNFICHASTPHKVHFLWRPFLPDSDDDMILELAVAASASHIVTHYIRDFRGCGSFGVTAITPGDFWKLLEPVL